jgi:hypothetical protein
VLDDFYGADVWKTSNEYKIDLVAHSQGGLVIREMLRGLRDYPGNIKEKGSENPANHIRKIVTVDTPHFGSMTAARKPQDVEKDFSGLATIIRDLDSDDTHTLVGFKVGKFLEMASVGIEEGSESAYKFGTSLCNGMNLGDYTQSCKATLGMVGNLLGSIGGFVVSVLTDVDVSITGKYLGPYYVKTTIDYPWPKENVVTVDTINTESVLNYIHETRKNGRHLAVDDIFITTLSGVDPIDAYPRLPDGSMPVVLPMYSDNTSAVLADFLSDLSEGTNRICANNMARKNIGEMGTQMDGCFNASMVFDRYVLATQGYHLNSSVFVNNDLWNILKSFQDDWLTKSDIVVEGPSQKFEKGDLNHANSVFEGRFQAPRNYVLHDALAPLEPVAHGAKSLTAAVKPLSSVITIGAAGAPDQSYDLLCALYDNGCGEYINEMGMGAVLRLSEADFQPVPSQPAQNQSAPVLARMGMNAAPGYEARTIAMSGDFSVAPIYVSEGLQGVAVQMGDNLSVIATYEPGIGSTIKWVQDGISHSEVIINERIATQPAISRNGNSIAVKFMNHSGRSFSKTLEFSDIPEQADVYVLAAKGSAMSNVLAGRGIPSNPETQKPPPPPPGHRLAPVTLAVIHREARGEHESNTSRPRFLVFNATEDSLEFSKVAYYFTADPARVPKVVVDYPYVPVSVENLGGDQWRFVFDVGNKKIAPKSFYPSADGWQIRVHYSDWYEYKHLDDWSADYSIGLVQLNRKIVIYDKNGKIIWGNEAPGFESEDNGIISTPKGTIAWKDDSPWETNTFKPRVTVKNTGSVALSDYHAQLWFRVPQGKSLSPLDIWYAPESSPSIKSVENAGGRVWMLDMRFDKHILYSGDSLSEGNIGLHLTDWSNFDKTVCGIVLKDKDGNVLFGKEPSVAECESYNGPNLLQPLYSRRH